MNNKRSPIKINLRKILQERGMTQAEFARLSGMNTTIVSRWAKGNPAMIMLRSLEQVCDTLGIEPGDLITRDS